MAVATDLPADIWEEIIAFLPITTLACVCLISKAFNVPGTRVLYRSIDLNTLHQTIGCLKTLKGNELAGRSTRNLWMNYKVELYPEGSVVMQGFFGLIAKALKRLPNLRTLEIRVVHREYPHLSEWFDYIFDDCTFPHLTMLLLYMPITPNLVSFLGRHQSTIRTLFLIPLTNYNTYRVAGNSWLFPSLTWLHVADTVAPNFLSSSTLPAVERFETTCSFEVPGVSVQELIKSIKKSCKEHTLMQLNFNRNGWNVELIEEIAANSVSSTILSVHCIWFNQLTEGDISLHQERLEKVQISLSKLPALRSFYWTVETKFGEHPPPQWNVDEEIDIILRFGKVCPSLNRCQLPHGLIWTRFVNDLWMPADDSAREFKVSRWLFTKLHARHYPADELLYLMDAYASLHSFVRDVIERFRDADNKLKSEIEEDKDDCKARTFDLMAVGMVLGFWYSSSFKRNPAYRKFRNMYP
ncbi:hypothetical protein VNI00_008093 [Paramarasmius palmivorus]|uniref:F-box domain-containing protein n=1 Tax=Paramarasmius palmivorus TaxID=297713 RepID=A0AAW0CXF3_9AGAR